MSENHVVTVTFGTWRLQSYATTDNLPDAERLRIRARKQGYTDAKIETQKDFRKKTRQGDGSVGVAQQASGSYREMRGVRTQPSTSVAGQAAASKPPVRPRDRVRAVASESDRQAIRNASDLSLVQLREDDRSN
jgi:hypothetical protein